MAKPLRIFFGREVADGKGGVLLVAAARVEVGGGVLEDRDRHPGAGRGVGWAAIALLHAQEPVE